MRNGAAFLLGQRVLAVADDDDFEIQKCLCVHAVQRLG
jgi:hypothetical protein